MTEAADRYWLASGGLLVRIQATPADRWDASSPCPGWTACDVVAHVINGHRGILAIVNGTRPVAADGVGVSAMADARRRSSRVPTSPWRSGGVARTCTRC